MPESNKTKRFFSYGPVKWSEIRKNFKGEIIQELKEVEKHIDDAERKVVSDDLAQEILYGKHCIGGHCDD